MLNWKGFIHDMPVVFHSITTVINQQVQLHIPTFQMYLISGTRGVVEVHVPHKNLIYARSGVCSRHMIQEFVII